MSDVRATLLGTGHAYPLPEPGCACDQCTASREDAEKRRTRSGMFIQTSGGNALLDACPDTWHQFEREGLEPRVDLVVISHHHEDHVLGLRDLSVMRKGGPEELPVHCGRVTEQRIRATFDSLLRREKIAILPWHSGATIELGPVRLEGFETHHRADEPTTAFLLHVERGEGTVRIAYATDMGSKLPSPRERLEGVDLFLGDGTCLGRGNRSHPGTDRMIQIGRELGAKRIAITHVGHWRLDPDGARQRVPADVAICRDGDDVFSFLD